MKQLKEQNLNDQSLTIYLAGKASGDKHKIAEIVSRSGIRFVCSDGSKHSEHGWGGGVGSSFVRMGTEAEVLDRALNEIRDADLLFAYLDSPTCFGTIAEIAWASALGKPILITVLRERHGQLDYGDEFQRVWREHMHDAYWFVCSFPNVRVHEVTERAQAELILQEYILGYEAGALRMPAGVVIVKVQ